MTAPIILNIQSTSCRKADLSVFYKIVVLDSVYKWNCHGKSRPFPPFFHSSFTHSSKEWCSYSSSLNAFWDLSRWRINSERLFNEYINMFILIAEIIIFIAIIGFWLFICSALSGGYVSAVFI